MTEEERAEFYDRSGDDPQVWVELDEAFHRPTQAKRQGGLSSTLTVRFAPDDAAKLRQLAERLDLSYSDVIREAVRQVLEPRFVVGRRQENVTYTVLQAAGTRRQVPGLNSLAGAETSTSGTAAAYRPLPD